MLLVALLLAACSPPAEAPNLGRPGTVQLGNVEVAEAQGIVSGGWATGAQGPASSDPAGIDLAGFGRDPHEPVGPWAVLRDGDGVAVLDQLRQRILRYDRDGRPRGSVPIPLATTFDAAARAEGGFHLLEWHPGDDPHWSVQGVAADGALGMDTRIALDPPTAVLTDGDRVLVEDRHGPTVDLATGVRYPGRPTGTGLYVRATKDDTRHVTLTWLDASGVQVSQVRLQTDRPLVNLLAVDPQGDEVLLGLFYMEVTTDRAAANPEIRAVRVDRRGRLHREVRLPAGVGMDPLRPLALLADGSILHLRNDTVGVTVARVAP